MLNHSPAAVSAFTSILNSSLLFLGLFIVYVLGIRLLHMRNLSAKDSSLAPQISIVNSPNSEEQKEGGFQFFEVNDQQKKAFIDALNGFKDYADLRGYDVTVLIDSTQPGRVGLKIIINDVGVTVSTSQVRRDVDEFIRKISIGDDLEGMPIVVDPIEHNRLVAAIKMRFSFLQHQASLNETTAEAYRALFAAVSANALGAIGYHPPQMAPNIHLRIQNEGGRSMSGTNTTTNSPGAAVGKGNKARITNSVIAIGATAGERSTQTNAVDDLISHIKKSNLDAEQKAEAVRNLTNVKEEMGESQTPDTGRIAKWLDRAKTVISLGAAGAELLEKADTVFSQFGVNS